MRATCVVAIVAASVFLPVAARADLKWDQTTIEIKTGPNDQVAVAHFKYQNTGVSPVRFKAVKPACGCTTVQSQQDAVPPGEKGEILARLNIGDRTGAQEKTITVETDEPMHPTTVLTIKALIPEPLEVTPTFLFWHSGEQAKPKTITVKVKKDWGYPVRAIKANASDLDFQTNVEKISKDEFKVEVRPRSTAQSSAANVTIEAEDSTRKYPVNLRVMGSGPAATLLPDPANNSNELLKNPFDGAELPSSPPPP